MSKRKFWIEERKTKYKYEIGYFLFEIKIELRWQISYFLTSKNRCVSKTLKFIQHLKQNILNMQYGCQCPIISKNNSQIIYIYPTLWR